MNARALSPELEYALSAIAEAKMHLLLTAQGTRPGTPERRAELLKLIICTQEARRYVDETIGGLSKLPVPVAVILMACEKGIDCLNREANLH